MTQSSLHSLSDDALLGSIKNAVQVERAATREVLLHLLEVERRRLYLSRGFASLFEFCTEKLGYCAGSAQIRIQSMRLIRDLPDEIERSDIMEKLDSGVLKLTQLATVQRFSRSVAMEQKRKVDANQKRELLQQIEGKTSRETEKIIIQVLALPQLQGTELKIHLDEEAMQLLQELKGLTSHSHPSGNDSLLLKEALRLAVAALKKKKGLDESRVTSCDEPDSTQQALPAPTRRFVWKRDGAQCSYVDLRTGRRCSSRHLLELDHIRERSRGGDHGPENLRLLCHAHHRWRHQGGAVKRGNPVGFRSIGGN